MIQLASKNLPVETINTLNRLQQTINSQITFEEKVLKAQALWNSKGGAEGKKAFDIVKETLYDMCFFVGICNYCEQNEASDIEHVFPKSYFPDQTFVWENYLLACKTCNSGYKLDKCYVLDEQGELVELQRGKEPTSKLIAIINPRIENPNDFMILNPVTHKYFILPDLSKHDSNKATTTVNILELNTRDTLIQARKSASDHYYSTLLRLTKIMDAVSVDELENELTPNETKFDLTLPVEQIKSDIKESYKKYIKNYQHPSVWYTIKKVLNLTSPKWQKIFKKIPEALSW